MSDLTPIRHLELHTPLPWNPGAVPFGYCIRANVCGESRVIATLQAHTDMSPFEHDANVRMMAAAPLYRQALLASLTIADDHDIEMDRLTPEEIAASEQAGITLRAILDQLAFLGDSEFREPEPATPEPPAEPAWTPPWKATP